MARRKRPKKPMPTFNLSLMVREEGIPGTLNLPGEIDGVSRLIGDEGRACKSPHHVGMHIINMPVRGNAASQLRRVMRMLMTPVEAISQRNADNAGEVRRNRKFRIRIGALPVTLRHRLINDRKLTMEWFEVRNNNLLARINVAQDAEGDPEELDRDAANPEDQDGFTGVVDDDL